jgi:hypothetical protein
MSLLTDELALIIQQSISDADATRDDWTKALDQVFGTPDTPNSSDQENTITVSLKVENIYPDDIVVNTVLDATVEAPETLESPGLDEWAFDELFPFTGTGRTDGASAYDITVTASSEPALVGRNFEFG